MLQDILIFNAHNVKSRRSKSPRMITLRRKHSAVKHPQFCICSTIGFFLFPSISSKFSLSGIEVR